MEQYSARRAFKYNGIDLDRGQVLSLQQCPNDDQLLRLGFLSKLQADQPLSKCGLCGEIFISDRQLMHHGDRLHAGMREPEIPVMTQVQGKQLVNRMVTDKNFEPALVPDETISAQDKENRDVPIFFEKTEASIRSGAGVHDITEELKDAAPTVVAPPSAARPSPIWSLTGQDLLDWRKSQGLSRKNASAILGIGVGSIQRAEGMKDKSLGPKLLPALNAILNRGQAPN